MRINKILCVDLEITDYIEALEVQRKIVKAKKAAQIKDDIILMLEHRPVFTLGRNKGRENLLVSEDFLSAQGIQIIQIERGGNITYHGPGQLVVYPILNINALKLGIKNYVTGLENIMVQTAAQWNIESSGHAQKRGVWIGNKKLGSIGIAVTQGISFHGIALNVNNDLKPFDWINPCGFDNICMTSMKAELAKEVSMYKVRHIVKNYLSEFLDAKLVQTDIKDMKNKYISAGSMSFPFRADSTFSRQA